MYSNVISTYRTRIQIANKFKSSKSSFRDFCEISEKVSGKSIDFYLKLPAKRLIYYLKYVFSWFSPVNREWRMRWGDWRGGSCESVQVRMCDFWGQKRQLLARIYESKVCAVWVCGCSPPPSGAGPSLLDPWNYWFLRFVLCGWVGVAPPRCGSLPPTPLKLLIFLTKPKKPSPTPSSIIWHFASFLSVRF